jgi:plastocyanin
MRAAAVCLLLLSCLPRVGPAVDGGSTGGGAADGGGAGGGSGTGGASNGGGVAAGGGTASGGGFVDTGCPGFASCVSYTDATAAGASREIQFPNGSDTYAPNCLRIQTGQTVTFTGSFGSHPLEQECGPAVGILRASSGNSAAFQLTVPGTYGYYCTQHGSPSGSGMAGAIEVVP